MRRELALGNDVPLAIGDSLERPVGAEFLVDEDEAIRLAFANRADFKAAIAQSDGVRGYARAAVAARLPTLSLYADHGSNGRETSRMLGTYSYGIQVTVPVFDGLRTEGRMSERGARQREALQLLNSGRPT